MSIIGIKKFFMKLLKIAKQKLLIALMEEFYSKNQSLIAHLNIF